MASDSRPQPNSRPKADDPFAPFNPEDYGFPPPLTKAQGLARRAEDRKLQENYPDRHVAFVDNWTGDVVERVVVAVSEDRVELNKLVAALDPEVRRKVETRYVRHPEDGFFIPVRLVDPSEPE